MITSPYDYQALLSQINNPNKIFQITKLPTDEPIYKINLQKRTIEAPEFLSVRKDHNAETVFFEVDRYFENIDLSKMTCVINFTNANSNRKANGFIYAPPFMDIVTSPGKIIIPWIIEGPATMYSGIVTFAFQFYSLIKTYNGYSIEEYEQVFGEGELPEYKRVGNISREEFTSKEGYYFVRKDYDCYFDPTYNADNIYYERRSQEALNALQISSYYEYNLNTLPAKSRVLQGMDELLNNENENYNYEVNTVRDIWEAIAGLQTKYFDENVLYWTIIEE